MMSKRLVFNCIILLLSVILISCSSDSTVNTNNKEITKSEATYSNQTINDDNEVSQTENTTKSPDEKSSDIKINGIYKMSIIGSTPKKIGLKGYDTNNVITEIGVVDCFENKFGISGHFYYEIDSISSYEIGGNTSIFDKRILQKIVSPNYPDQIDINKLVLVYFKRPRLQDAPQVVAYSKIADMKHRMNNIQNVKFDGKVESSDILIDVAAVVKENQNYKLISETMDYNAIGELPKEMSDAAIKRPEGDYPTVDINKLFVVYMTSFTVNKSDDGKEVYSVKVLTCSPLSGGEPINMDEQGL